MRLTMCVLAETVIKSENGLVSLINIFNKLSPPSTPVVHPRMLLAVSFNGAIGETGTLTGIMADTDGVPFITIPEIPFELSEENGDGSSGYGSALLLGVMENAVFPKYGQYIFTVKLDNAVVAELPLLVAQDHP